MPSFNFTKEEYSKVNNVINEYLEENKKDQKDQEFIALFKEISFEYCNTLLFDDETVIEDDEYFRKENIETILIDVIQNNSEFLLDPIEDRIYFKYYHDYLKNIVEYKLFLFSTMLLHKINNNEKEFQTNTIFLGKETFLELCETAVKNLSRNKILTDFERTYTNYALLVCNENKEYTEEEENIIMRMRNYSPNLIEYLCEKLSNNVFLCLDENSTIVDFRKAVVAYELLINVIVINNN